MAEETSTTEQDLKKAQMDYNQLCAQHGHIRAQILKAERDIEKLEGDLESNLHEMKQLFKRVEGLNQKLEFERKKAAEIAKVETKEVSNG
jgi:DNA repair exonuclease SbcCD ATPase subunit